MIRAQGAIASSEYLLGEEGRARHHSQRGDVCWYCPSPRRGYWPQQVPGSAHAGGIRCLVAEPTLPLPDLGGGTIEAVSLITHYSTCATRVIFKAIPAISLSFIENYQKKKKTQKAGKTT